MSTYNDCPCGDSELGCNCPEVRDCLDTVLEEPTGILVDSDESLPVLVQNKFDFYDHFLTECLSSVPASSYDTVTSFKPFFTSSNNA